MFGGREGVVRDGPHARVEAREVAEVLQSALLSLDVGQRSAFVLRVCEGMPYAEVSDVLEIPVATARTHVHRARAVLKRSLSRGG